MGKVAKFIVPAVFIMIFLAVVYNSKRADYENEKSFSKKYFNGQVLKIVEGRGTQIYYSETDFFYAISEVDFKVGDIFKKTTDSLEVYRNDKVTAKVKVEKPAETYFEYFTAW